MQLAALRARAHAAAGVLRQGQGDIARQALDQAVFAGGQSVEVGVAQAVDVAGRHGRVKIHFLVFGFGLGLLGAHLGRRQGFSHAGPAFARFSLAFGAGQHLRQKLVAHVRVAEKGLKEFAKNCPVLLAADQHRLHGGAQVVPVAQADFQRRLRAQADAGAVHLHPSAAQRTPESGQVARQLSCTRIA